MWTWCLYEYVNISCIPYNPLKRPQVALCCCKIEEVLSTGRDVTLCSPSSVRLFIVSQPAGERTGTKLIWMFLIIVMMLCQCCADHMFGPFSGSCMYCIIYTCVCVCVCVLFIDCMSCFGVWNLRVSSMSCSVQHYCAQYSNWIIQSIVVEVEEIRLRQCLRKP